MRYNFSKMTDRLNTNSVKWNGKENELPMWVADMDFEVAPEIVEAIQKKLDHRIFGYTLIPEEYYSSIGDWWKRRHDFEIKKEWILFCTGVVPAISAIIQSVTNERDSVIIQSPVYNAFYRIIKDDNRQVLSSDLLYEDGEYSIDFNDLEEKLARPSTTLMILCNPHNPIGKIWDKETLKKIGDLCIKHNVLVLSDEIHCDLTLEGEMYTPFAKISPEFAQNSITCIAPTKTFNLAGIQSSSIVIPNEELRHKVNQRITTGYLAAPNSFAMEATVAAFTYGESWLNELVDYLVENKKFIQTFIQEQLPQIKVIDGKATYLMWLDCNAITNNTTPLCKHLKDEVGLHLLEGELYGDNGASFIRLNYACSRERLEDGLMRLKKGIEEFKTLK